MADRWKITAFIAGRDGKKRPYKIGTIIPGADKHQIYISAVPIGWDGSAVAEPDEERAQGYGGGGGQRGGSYGGGGSHGASPSSPSAPSGPAPRRGSMGGGEDY